MLRMGSGEPLLLFHGIMGSEHHWQQVAPLLASDHDVIAPTALGHRGGPEPGERPVSISAMIDCAERQMDDLSIERAHMAGNSMGGWMALELARRGRALSVCALSPAGVWAPGGRLGERPAVARLREAVRTGRLTRPVLPLLVKSRALRRFAMRNVAVHGERPPVELILTLTHDMLGCRVAEDLFHSVDYLAPLDPVPCPVMLAWAEHDRIFPEPGTGRLARERVPGARYLVLHGVGHVPMLDDPGLVARVIGESVAAAGSSKGA